MRTSAAFAPGHVTGFFSIQDQDEDLLKKGSTGAGFCLSRGVRTTLTESKATWIKIGDDICEAPVSRKVLEVFSRRAGKSLPPLNIHHEIDIPLGSGFGSWGKPTDDLKFASNPELPVSVRLYFSPSLKPGKRCSVSMVPYPPKDCYKIPG